MDTSPFFSIIMAAYNVEQFIEEAINSVISQTYEAWELIIVDDGSTDGTNDAIKKYTTDERIKIINSEKNSGGCFVPREKGSNQAKGNYIVHFDGDDLLKPDHLQKLYDVIQRKSSDLVLAEMWRFAINPESAYKILTDSGLDMNLQWRGRDLVKHTLPDWKIPVAGYAVKREIYLKANSETKAFTQNFNLADELHTRLMLFFSEKVNFSDAIYLYRKNTDSVTSNKYGDLARVNLINTTLLSFTQKFYGENSCENKLAKKGDILFIFSLYDLYHTGQLSKIQKKELNRLIHEKRRGLEKKKCKELLSFPYYISILMPVWMGMKSYSVIKTLKKQKR